ncbi:MAG: cob(I)yrinic acid a,c-diamide adenosyltransferase [Alistipes sp.]|nr:cob(I)yrinic acid a,c-diamide adenosyltransferase [Alistipes sp.]
MKIYTKQGDSGLTSLIGGERVFKTDSRVEAYGTVDELSAFVAMLADLLKAEEGMATYITELHRILTDAMTVEALLAVGEGGEGKVGALPATAVTMLEQAIDRMQAEVPPITKFTLPGGHPVLSMCHICRTVSRRAERAALRADRDHEAGVPVEVKQWLNRLSDYFYLLGRRLTLALDVEEVEWIP